jgi:hypothetical protein
MHSLPDATPTARAATPVRVRTAVNSDETATCQCENKCNTDKWTKQHFRILEKVIEGEAW